MKREDFFEVLGELDGDLVKRAKATPRNKMNGRAWGAVAACLAVFLAAASVIPRMKPPETGPHGYETILATETLRIYYLSESGAIENKSVELPCDPEDIFIAWAALNRISDVTFVDCIYNDNGDEKTQGGVTEHTVGSYYTLDLTVSREFSSYAKGEGGDLLMQSLRQTFCDYRHADEFNLIIDD